MRSRRHGLPRDGLAPGVTRVLPCTRNQKGGRSGRAGLDGEGRAWPFGTGRGPSGGPPWCSRSDASSVSPAGRGLAVIEMCDQRRLCGSDAVRRHRAGGRWPSRGRLTCSRGKSRQFGRVRWRGRRVRSAASTATVRSATRWRPGVAPSHACAPPRAPGAAPFERHSTAPRPPPPVPRPGARSSWRGRRWWVPRCGNSPLHACE